MATVLKSDAAFTEYELAKLKQPETELLKVAAKNTPAQLFAFWQNKRNTYLARVK